MSRCGSIEWINGLKTMVMKGMGNVEEVHWNGHKVTISERDYEVELETGSSLSAI